MVRCQQHRRNGGGFGGSGDLNADDDGGAVHLLLPLGVALDGHLAGLILLSDLDHLVHEAGGTHQFWVAVKTGADAAAKDYDVDIYFNGPASETEIDAQVNMVKGEMAKNPKALALAALSTDAVKEILEECASKNIPVIGFDSGVPDDPI